MEMISPNQYREMYKEKSLNELLIIKEKLESDIEKLSKEDNNNPIFPAETRLAMNTQYLDEIKKLIAEKENTINNIPNKEPFKLFQLKYTKHHWMSGEIVNGCPITTSIEIKPEMLGNKWIVNIIHKYMLEDDHEEKTINKRYDLPSQETVVKILENNDLRDLKNNYFSDDKIQRYSHWELEYNYYFRISGTFDQEPEEVKKVVSILNCENIINEALQKVDEMIKPIHDKVQVENSLAESIYQEIKKLPNNSEFTIGQFFNNYDIEEKSKFGLIEQVISYCSLNNVILIEKMPGADLGLPWNIPRIKIDYEYLNDTIKETIKEEDMSMNNLIFEILKKIINAPSDSELSIGKLISYNPNENFAEPLFQGKVYNYTFDICDKLNIKLEEKRDGFGGLAYNYLFKKI